MHKYFLIPAIIFFLIIIILQFHQQFINEDWKWAVIPNNFDVKTKTYQKKTLPYFQFMLIKKFFHIIKIIINLS